MSFLTKTMTKELRSIPFDAAYEMYMDAASMAEQTLDAENQERYDAFIQQKESEYADVNEAPYEGNFSDQYPYQKHPDTNKVRTRAGQTALIKEFIPKYKLETIMQTWVMPQVIAWLTHKPINIAEMLTESGKISGQKMASAIFDFGSEWDLGLYQFLMLDSRSAWISGQYKGEGRTYCSLVPLILYAFKLHKNIKYSEWDRDTLHLVVNDGLCKAMLCEPPEITREEILLAREQGLTFKSGTKAGTVRSPLSTFKLYDTTGTKLHKVPELAQTMIAQIWCAHPTSRTKYMVLDPKAWDSIPVPLITTDIFKSSNTSSFPKKTPTEGAVLPWL